MDITLHFGSVLTHQGGINMSELLSKFNSNMITTVLGTPYLTNHPRYPYPIPL